MYHRYTPNGNGSFSHEAIATPTPPEIPETPKMPEASQPTGISNLDTGDLLILLILLLLMSDGNEDAMTMMLTIAIFLVLQ